MPPLDERPPVQQSLLDRLVDDDPGRSNEITLTGPKLMRALRNAIRRDVQALLNTRRRCVPLPDGLDQLRGGIADYGIPDFSSRNLTSRKRREEFVREIEACIVAHEPRFKKVGLKLVGDIDVGTRSLDFRIDAVVFAEPAPEQMVFDSRIEPVSRTFRVEFD